MSVIACLVAKQPGKDPSKAADTLMRKAAGDLRVLSGALPHP